MIIEYFFDFDDILFYNILKTHESPFIVLIVNLCSKKADMQFYLSLTRSILFPTQRQESNRLSPVIDKVFSYLILVIALILSFFYTFDKNLLIAIFLKNSVVIMLTK